MPQAAPRPAGKPAPPRADRPPLDPDAVSPEPLEEGAIFHALLDAGTDARVAYTAEKRLLTMISGAIAPQLQPFVREVNRRFDEQDRKLDALVGEVRELARAVAVHDRRLAVLAAQMRLLFGAMGLPVTILIAVFGFLFANTN